jgi:hypothetical protein
LVTRVRRRPRLFEQIGEQFGNQRRRQADILVAKAYVDLTRREHRATDVQVAAGSALVCILGARRWRCVRAHMEFCSGPSYNWLRTWKGPPTRQNTIGLARFELATP